MVSQSQQTNSGEKRHQQRGGVIDTSLENGGARNHSVQDADIAQLTEEEQCMLRRQIDTPGTEIGILTLFRYATKHDLLVISISSVSAICGGGILPLMSIIFGSFAEDFQSFTARSSLEKSAFDSALATKTLYLVYLAIGEYVLISISTFGFIHTGARITQALREQYLAAIMRQNIAFFDTAGTGQVITQITTDLNLVQEGISEKVGFTMTGLATFVVAFAIGFGMYWELTLILSGTLFSVLLSLVIVSVVAKKYSTRTLSANASAAALSDEVISLIRNIIAFNTQEKLAKQYDIFLARAERSGFRLGMTISCLLATCIAIVELTYALAFWQGSRFLVDDKINLAKLLTTALAIVLGSFALVNIAVNFQAFIMALSAARKIYCTIDRISPLDPESQVGIKLECLKGEVELQDIKHVYPSRPEISVIDNLNIVFPAGKVTALVGPSGSGKSTIIGLIERFYEPLGGRILIDGYDISTLNLKWMRQQLALVSQEPTIFGTTIYDNIRHGLIGTPHENATPEVQEVMIVKAAKAANIHDFIAALPMKYQTQVGQRGLLLSGGQKQRIAISRAVVSDPKILLLDEATSALDTKSEGAVQIALKAASKGRTTIMIAHRLSTIKSADNIVVMSAGRVIEQGNHDTLLERESAYHALVQAQEMLEEVKPTKEEDGKAFEDVEVELQAVEEAHGPLKEKRLLHSYSQEPVVKYSSWTLFKTFLSFNSREVHVMAIGLFFSVLAGGTYPAQSLFFAESVSALALPPLQFTKLRHETNFWSWMYFMLALVAFVNFLIQGTALGFCSVKMTSRVGSKAFRDIIKQDLSFFDREENTVGSLTSFLATEPMNLAGYSGSTLGAIVSVISTIISALALSISFSWKLGLVCGATIPVMLTCGFYRFWILAQFAKRSREAYTLSASHAAEAISAIQTIASLTREKEVLEIYHKTLVGEQRHMFSLNLKSSNLYAVSQALPYLCMALGFWFGGRLISKQEIGIFEFYLCYNALIFTIQSAGRILAFAPELGKADNAALQLKMLSDTSH